MRHARSQAAAVVLDNYLYVIGGNAPGRTVLTSVERYNFDDVSINIIYDIQANARGFARVQEP